MGEVGTDPGDRPSLDLSVVVPAYNEEAVIGGSVETLCAWLETREASYEVLVVDDGSRDRTTESASAVAVRRPGRVRVLRRDENHGKGSAIQQGVLHARGRKILLCDADLSTPIEDLERLEAALGEGGDVAIGSRAARGSAIEVRQPFHREWMGRVFNAIARVVVLRGIRDTQCGFKLFTGEAARAVFPLQTVGGFCFDLEILWLARRAGFRIREVPVRWRNRKESRVRVVRDSAAMLLDMFRIRLLRRRSAGWRFARTAAEGTREVALPPVSNPETRP
ncbi:MAG TPA: dolichyl-phosphate beta-glucosyltransferase [Planctomycetota bacterium]|jgi:dolichyl-phosphate beta-glucosyltransferase|nr:dolichyl-phosphate beta-glucosyltransferase [Planctomycetota bacterium]